MTRTGMIKEISALYVFVDEQGNETKVRFTWNDNINRFKPGDIIDFELEERESKEDPEIKYLWFKEITHAAAPKPEEAFHTEKTVSHPSTKLPGVEVQEPVKTQVVTTVEYPTKDIIMARESALKSAVVYNQGKDVPSGAVVKDAKVFEDYILRKE